MAVVVEVDSKKIIILISLVVLLLIPNTLANFQEENYQQKRLRILNELSLVINEAKAQGKYNCCIDPPCTMCYLGEWIWKDGVCRCDEMVAKGEFDKVCPQCKKGVGEGLCKSTNKNICDGGIFNTSLGVLK